MKKKIFFIIVFLFFLSVLPLVVSAESPIQDKFDIRILQPGSRDEEPSYIKRAKDLTGEEGETPDVSPVLVFIADTIDFLTAIIGSFSLLVFIVGALYMLVSEGQEDRLQKGKQAMVYALIGLAIALFAYVITTAVQSIFF